MSAIEKSVSQFSEPQAWGLIRSVAESCASPDARYWGCDVMGLPRTGATRTETSVLWQEPDGWHYLDSLPMGVQALFDLYLPICGTPKELVVAHLGQSLDGHIATQSGDSIYVTGHDNIVHLHRMRALCDAVVVGAQTVFSDDPRLTTRLVEGTDAVRVVLDPQRRLRQHYNVFTDAHSPTLLVCQQGLEGDGRFGQAEVLGIPVDASGRFELPALLAVLRERGLKRIFVEGGGVAVSAFLDADALERMHIAVAPLVIGSGRPGIRLPTIDQLADGRRPGFQVFQMGSDMLFDMDLRQGSDKLKGLERYTPGELSLRRVFPKRR